MNYGNKININYNKVKFQINQDLLEKIRNNPLWIRTVDTGSWDGRAGLYSIKENFDGDGINMTLYSYC